MIRAMPGMGAYAMRMNPSFVHRTSNIVLRNSIFDIRLSIFDIQCSIFVFII